MKTFKIGEIFDLPFGKYRVKNHYSNSGAYIRSVYIENVFGEPQQSFIYAYKVLTEAIEYGAVIPDRIKVICVCKLELEGRYLELCAIVDAIKEIQSQVNSLT